MLGLSVFSCEMSSSTVMAAIKDSTRAWVGNDVFSHGNVSAVVHTELVMRVLSHTIRSDDM